MKVFVSTNPPGSGFVQMSTKAIDWTNSSDRRWLMNHLHWAMHNDNTVTLSPSSN